MSSGIIKAIQVSVTGGPEVLEYTEIAAPETGPGEVAVQIEGRAYLLRSLYVESLKGAYGLSRSAKSKVMPVLLLVVMVLPALIIAFVAGLTNADELPLKYTSYAIDLATGSVAWRQTGFNNKSDQVSSICTPQAAAVALAHIA